jgi:glycerol-3-phosphate acyltransferase PlsY
VETALAYVVMPLVAYLVGSIPVGYLLVRAVRGIDVRTVGSGNVGATNVSRALGPRYGVLAFTLDFAKGFLPTLLLAPLAHEHLVPHRTELLLGLVYGGCAIAGHLYPVYLRFSGGKGVATSAGAMLAAATVQVVLTAVVWLGALAFTRRVSAASIMAALALPVVAAVVAWRRGQGAPGVLLVAACAVLSLVVIWRHRSNLRRILDGTEPRIGRNDA